MKYLFLMFILISSVGFSQERIDEKLTLEQKERFSIAKTEVIEGVLVFVNSKPVEKYTIVGDVIMNAFDSRKYNDQIYVLVDKAKDKYPGLHGIIVKTNGNRFQAEVITFNTL